MNYIVCSLLIATVVYASSLTAQTQEKKTVPENAKNVTEVTIPVNGMSCGDCCNSVESATKSVEGVLEVEADHEKGQARVKFDKSKTDIDKVVSAINENTGFKASKPEKNKK